MRVPLKELVEELHAKEDYEKQKKKNPEPE